MTQPAHPDTVLIIDFGSQVTQLIARRVREAGVYCEIVPFQSADEGVQAPAAEGHHPLRRPGLDGRRGRRPRAPQMVFDRGMPVLGICYGQQTMCDAARRQVESGHHREFGRAFLEIEETARCSKASGPSGARHQVWMSHGDRVTAAARRLPASSATSTDAPSPPSPTRSASITACSSIPRSCTRPTAPSCIATSCTTSPASRATGSMAAYRQTARSTTIREQVGDKRVICAPFGRRRLLRRGAADPRGDRRPADLHPRRPRADAQGRGAATSWRCSANTTICTLIHVDAADLFHRRARRRQRSGDTSARSSAASFIEGVRGRGQEARRRRLPRPGHALSRRDRKRFLHRRPVGDDQVAPQCRRPARAQ